MAHSRTEADYEFAVKIGGTVETFSDRREKIEQN